jgi:hypothetical protein
VHTTGSLSEPHCTGPVSQSTINVAEHAAVAALTSPQNTITEGASSARKYTPLEHTPSPGSHIFTSSKPWRRHLEALQFCAEWVVSERHAPLFHCLAHSLTQLDLGRARLSAATVPLLSALTRLEHLSLQGARLPCPAFRPNAQKCDPLQ